MRRHFPCRHCPRTGIRSPPPYLIAKALTGEIRQRSSFVPGVSAKREYRIHTSRPPRLRYGGALYCKKDTGIETFHPCTSVISIVRKPRLLDCKMSAMRSSPTCSYGIGAIPAHVRAGHNTSGPPYRTERRILRQTRHGDRISWKATEKTGNRHNKENQNLYSDSIRIGFLILFV